METNNTDFININKNMIDELLKIRGQNIILSEVGFQALLNQATNNILSYLGIYTLEPQTYKDKSLYNEHNPHQYLLKHFPVTEIISVSITNKYTNYTTNLNVDKDIDYDANSGIVRLKNHNIQYHTITITYKSGFSQSILSSIESLIIDTILLNSLPNDSGNITSLHEGDLTISYDTSHTLASSVQSRLDELRNRLNLHTRVI